jgi:ornithine lipid hydroxylase
MQRMVASTVFPLCLMLAVCAAFLVVYLRLPIAWATLGVPVAVLALVAIMERLYPYEREWNRGRGDVPADLASLLLVAGLFEPVIGVLGTSVAATIYAGMNSTGWLQSHFPSNAPLLVQAVLLVLLADLGKYWLHRLAHETDLLWRLHSVHHSVKRVYWLNGFRIHPLYHLVNFIVGILPWLCLGASAEAVALYTAILATSAAFQHANIDLRNGVLNRIFNTNEVHRWHHSRVLSESNANYGAVTLLWDQMFGTYRFRQHDRPQELGMVDESGYPMNSYRKQLLVPFAWTVFKND